MSPQTKTKLFASASFCIICFLLVYLYAHHSRSERAKATQIGDQVVQALEAYHFAYGSYPTSLEKLSPDFITEIPKPDWGVGSWFYRSGGGLYPDEFVLSVYRDRDAVGNCLSYVSGKDDWMYYKDGF